MHTGARARRVERASFLFRLRRHYSPRGMDAARGRGRVPGRRVVAPPSCATAGHGRAWPWPRPCNRRHARGAPYGLRTNQSYQLTNYLTNGGPGTCASGRRRRGSLVRHVGWTRPRPSPRDPRSPPPCVAQHPCGETRVGAEKRRRERACARAGSQRESNSRPFASKADAKSLDHRAARTPSDTVVSFESAGRITWHHGGALGMFSRGQVRVITSWKIIPLIDDRKTLV